MEPMRVINVSHMDTPYMHTWLYIHSPTPLPIGHLRGFCIVVSPPPPPLHHHSPLVAIDFPPSYGCTEQAHLGHSNMDELLVFFLFPFSLLTIDGGRLAWNIVA
jgi:hypothetical protein